MSVISKDQLMQKIKRGGYRCAKIYDKDYRQVPSNIPYFESYEEQDADQLASALDRFYATYSTWQGIFTIILRKSPTGNLSGAALVRINTASAPPQQQQQMNGGNGQPIKTADQIYNEVLEQVKTQMQITMFQAQIKQKDAQLEELSTTSGRLGYMFENFLMAKMGKNAPLFQNGATMQGHQQNTNDQNEEISEDDFGKALVKIKDKFGVETLMKVAEKIESNDPQIDLLINMLNNGK